MVDRDIVEALLIILAIGVFSIVTLRIGHSGSMGGHTTGMQFHESLNRTVFFMNQSQTNRALETVGYEVGNAVGRIPVNVSVDT